MKHKPSCLASLVTAVASRLSFSSMSLAWVRACCWSSFWHNVPAQRCRNCVTVWFSRKASMTFSLLARSPLALRPPQNSNRICLRRQIQALFRGIRGHDHRSSRSSPPPASSPQGSEKRKVTRRTSATGNAKAGREATSLSKKASRWLRLLHCCYTFLCLHLHQARPQS